VYLKELAEKLTTELNVYADTFKFEVTDNKQLYDEYMELDDLNFIPVIITTQTTFKQENKYIENVVYQLMFYVKTTWESEFVEIYKSWVDSQVNEEIDSQQVYKTTQGLIHTTNGIDNGTQYDTYTAVLNWTYITALSGNGITVKVDDETVPFVSIEGSHDKSYISNQSEGTNDFLTDDMFVLTVPLNFVYDKIVDLLDESNNSSYNVLHEITLVMADKIYTKNMVLRKKYYNTIKNSSLASVSFTFGTEYPRVTVQINEVSIPVVSYTYNPKTNFELDNVYGETKIYGLSTDKINRWVLKIANDSSATYNSIYEDMRSSTVGTKFTLTDKDGEDYTVEVGEINESFTETGNQAIEISLTEVRA
jgi:hypothetical protein